VPKRAKKLTTPSSSAVGVWRRIVLSSPESSPTVAVQPWIPGDRDLLISGAWLNDKLMDACNTLVARHTGNDNNQSTLLVQGPGSGFKPTMAM